MQRTRILIVGLAWPAWPCQGAAPGRARLGGDRTGGWLGGRRDRHVPPRQRRTRPPGAGPGRGGGRPGRRDPRQRLLDHHGRLLAEIDLGDLWRDLGPCLALPGPTCTRSYGRTCRCGWATPSGLWERLDGPVKVTFDDSSGEFDLVVGADGLRSSVRRLTVDDQPPIPVGRLTTAQAASPRTHGPATADAPSARSWTEPTPCGEGSRKRSDWQGLGGRRPDGQTSRDNAGDHHSIRRLLTALAHTARRTPQHLPGMAKTAGLRVPSRRRRPTRSAGRAAPARPDPPGCRLQGLRPARPLNCRTHSATGSTGSANRPILPRRPQSAAAKQVADGCRHP